MTKRLEAEWRDFAGKLLAHALPIQRQEMRRAFYAGAVCIMDSLSRAVSHEDEATPADLRVIEDFQTEIKEYLIDLQEGRE